MIKAGHVQLEGEIARKAGVDAAGKAVTVLVPDHPYVSRGALKLKALLEAVGRRLDEAVVLDLGASTGGFTQVALEFGASHVYALDVGTSQLAPNLRENPKVTVFEQTDARQITADLFNPQPQVMSADLSFISLTKVLPEVLGALPVNELFLLVKPQFELEPADIGKNGLVKDENARRRAVENVRQCLESEGFEVCFYMTCPVQGGDGNQEYLMHAVRQ